MANILASVLAYVVLDIETGFAPDEAVQKALAGWEPPANIKDPEKLAERRSQAYASLVDKSALFDEAPITSVAVVSGKMREVYCGKNERATLQSLRKLLDSQTGPETVLVGHNVTGFDIPKLRAAYIRHRLALPMILRVDLDETKRPRVFDTMRTFRYFTSWRHEDRFVSLADVIDAFGLPRYKSAISGKEMPALAARGEWETIQEYNLLDAVATEAVYLLMTASHADLK